MCIRDRGVDRLFVDESHAFKNLFLFTKMRDVYKRQVLLETENDGRPRFKMEFENGGQK